MLWTNATKETIRLRKEGGGGLKKLILQNNDKSFEMHYRLIVINASTQLDMSHIQSYINSMGNIMILIRSI